MTALTTAGAVFLAQAAINDSPSFFTTNPSGVASAAWQGAGNSSSAFAIGQTDLQGASKERASATVSRASGVLTFVSTFGTSAGNYEWLEVGIFNNSSGGTMLCRGVQSPTLGTKTSAQVWVLTTTVTFTAS